MTSRHDENPSAKGSAPEELPTILRPGESLDDDPPNVVIHVTQGPDKGTKLALSASDPLPVLIGTSPACQMRLTDREVSRRHAAVLLDGSILHLVDQRSTNGTWVNGVPIVDVIVRGGESVRVGSTTLSIERVQPAGSAKLAPLAGFGRLLGTSGAMRRLYPLCDRLAKSDMPVLIEGETGTGKELLAESLHEASPRASGPFVVFDCSAVSPSLVESHLFGHERGAFTGASAQRRGVFELAHQGTLFIDEIGDLDIALQSRLLRATERGEVCRVGAEKWLRVDVRIIAATRRDLDREVQAGRFRDDLFYRLAVTRLELPPLRHRHGDIAMLARHFWQKLAGPSRPIPYDLFEQFEDMPWPGNVRELYNAVGRRVALGDLIEQEPSSDQTPAAGTDSTASDFFDQVLSRDLPFPTARDEVVAEFERRYVTRVLSKHGGDAGKAAAASGIARRYFNLIRARYR